jgi:hypothetical protein
MNPQYNLKQNIFSFIFFFCFSSLSFAEGFFISFPVGVQSVRAADVNSSLMDAGYDSISDLADAPYRVGLGYEWGSGFRLSAKGASVAVADHGLAESDENFISYTITKGSLAFDFKLLGATTGNSLYFGTALGASLSRFTRISDSMSGVSQNIEGFVEPGIAYNYGGNSVKFFFETSYPVVFGNQFKTFGNAGIASLDGPRLSVMLGLIVYL